MIYRHLVRSRYLSLDDEYPSGTYARPDLSILGVSKLISHEAMESLYSDSVFRFVVDSFDRGTTPVYGKVAQLNRIASMMKNLVIDIDGYSLETAELYKDYVFTPQDQEIQNAKDLEQSLDATIDPFGGAKIKRQSLHVRFLDCCPTLRGSTLFSTICQKLKALVGFRIVTVEVLPSPHMLHAPRIYEMNGVMQVICARDLVHQVTHAVTAELQPTLGPAISVFQCDADNPRTPKGSVFDVGDECIVGFLEFHPGKQSVKESASGK